MSNDSKPHGATHIVNEVTDPRGRRLMLTVILNCLQECRALPAKAEGTNLKATVFSASRYQAMAVLLLLILREADLADEEVETVKRVVRRTIKVEWHQRVKEMPRGPKQPLMLLVLKKLVTLCQDFATLSAKGVAIDNPEILAEEQEFLDRTEEYILKSDLSDEEKSAAIISERTGRKPHSVTAMESGIELLCKILRESKLDKHEILTCLDVLERQHARAYWPHSSVPETLRYTGRTLYVRLPT